MCSTWASEGSWQQPGADCRDARDSWSSTFLCDNRRLHKLKTAKSKSAPKFPCVMDVRIETAEAQKKEKVKGKAASTKDKQDKDEVTLGEVPNRL